ncbi:hypothetical protein C8J57DRAFT_1438029 [Mycena rebaudengoi]|nr:hypothetical protein C8J57DRAFT_1438029 [Mycena rebaudengoi]
MKKRTTSTALTHSSTARRHSSKATAGDLNDILEAELEEDMNGPAKEGLIPCAPFSPTFAVATRVLEMFRLARLRCPTLSIDSWVKTLHDLHGSAFRPYRAQQFTICYDLYLAIREVVHVRVTKAIGRDEADSRMKTCCPACTYKLEGEADLVFRCSILRKDRHIYDDDGIQQRGANERVDPRTESAGGSYFLSCEKVDMWAKERLASLVKVPTSKDPEQASACEERWKNLSEDLTSKMWGIFDETGVFVALCRHGFTLLLADMVRSGELAKYPLAMVDALLDAFGPKLGAGYDIGCGFETTIKNSPLGPRAKAMQLKCLVGAFHGHAHNRKCQLEYLANYVPGMGLEDLEGCERLFSKSNALARSVRYASVFHRRQTIATWLAHHDTFETYANLSKFLVNNYYQAITILDTEDSLKFAMEQQGIQDVSEFPRRLAKELEVLQTLSHLPPEWTEKMDYYQLLVNLKTRKYHGSLRIPCVPQQLMCIFSCREKFNNVCSEGSTSSATVRRHAREAYDKAVEETQATEARLAIEARWSEGDPAWVEAATLVSKQRYHKAVNRLEELVVKRMFELTKMNMSQTGYKMRKHIATALQTRSKAIRNALKNYNLAAAALSPPARRLEWAEVIDYTFLADFDLLRGGTELETILPWATPASRMLMDSYFRIERAKEEITRLDIEIRRVVTHIRDERAFFIEKETFFVRRHRFERERFDMKLQKKLGARFTGTLEPGVRLVQAITQPASMEGVEDTGREAAEKAAVDLAAQMESLAVDEDSDSEWEEYDGDDAEEERVAELIETVLTAATD